MELLKTIDALISTLLIRWLMLALLIVCFIIIAYLKVENIAISTSLSSQKAQNANLGASIDLQSNLVKKQGNDMELLKKRLQKAYDEANLLHETSIKFDSLSGSCDEAVSSVTDTIISIRN